MVCLALCFLTKKGFGLRRINDITVTVPVTVLKFTGINYMVVMKLVAAELFPYSCITSIDKLLMCFAPCNCPTKRRGFFMDVIPSQQANSRRQGCIAVLQDVDGFHIKTSSGFHYLRPFE